MRTPFLWTRAIWIAFFGILLVGCPERPATRTSRPSAKDNRGSPLGAVQSDQTTPAAGTGGSMPEKIGVQLIDERDLAKALAQRNGKVVLVDFWATWCMPCMELFPHTVQLHRSLANKGFEVISVSLDDPDNEPEVLRFLVSKGAEFGNFVSRYGTSTKSMEAFKIPGGSLPHLRLYDRQGAVHRTFDAGSFQPADIDRAVQELLDAS
jgi:thiol-disulfide isomerase/thioredoxin